VQAPEPAVSATASTSATATANATALVASFNTLQSFFSANPMFATQAQQLSTAVTTNAALLSSVGITQGSKGSLLINQGVLQSAASSNLSGLRSALSGLVSATSTSVAGAQAEIQQAVGAATAPTTALISSGANNGLDLSQLLGGAINTLA
jgi:hypothetical protein